MSSHSVLGGIKLEFSCPRSSTLRSHLNELARLRILTIVKRASSFNRDLRVLPHLMRSVSTVTLESQHNGGD